MAALRRELREAGRITAHYGPRHLAELAALSASILFVAGLTSGALLMGAA